MTTDANGFKTTVTNLKGEFVKINSGQFSGALGNISRPMTEVTKQTDTLRTKLSSLGSSLSSNATSFGVAGASIWGVYNAYDNLIKIQLRAEAATNRANSLETTLQSLLTRRAEAMDKGNLSAAEMAVLNDRITDTQAKLATQQARAADLQGDVNEAFAAFATTVGPQVIAAGGSIVQLATNLRGSFGGGGGAIAAIKNAFVGLIPGLAAAKKEALLLSPALGGLPAVANGAAQGMGTMGTAAKGLLLSLGPIALVIGGITIAIMAFQRAMDEAAKTKASIAAIEKNVGGLQERIKQTNAEIDKFVAKPFGSGFLEDIGNTLSKTLPFHKQFVDEIKRGNEEKQIMADRDEGAAKALADYSAAVRASIDAQGSFNPLLIAHTDLEVRRTKAVLLATLANDKSAKSLNTLSKDAFPAVATSAEEWINKEIEADAKNKIMLAGLKQLATDMGVTVPAGMANTIEAYQELILRNEGIIPATENAAAAQKAFFAEFGLGQITLEQHVANMAAATQAEIDYQNAVNDANLKLSKNIQDARIYAAENKALTATFGPLSNAVLGNTEIRKLAIDIHLEQTEAFKKEEVELVKLASAHGVVSNSLLELIANEEDNIVAMANMIKTSIDWKKALTDVATNQKLVAQGQVAGVAALDDFTSGLVSGAAQAKVFDAGIRELGENITNRLPKGIQLTTSELQGFIEEESRGVDITGQLVDIVQNSLAPAFEQLHGILGATNIKDFNAAWKELDLKKLGIPQSTRDSLKDLGKDLIDTNKHAKEAAVGLSAVFAIAFGGKSKGLKSGIKELVQDLKEIPGADQIKPFTDELERIMNLPKGDRAAALQKLGPAIALVIKAMAPDELGLTMIDPGEAEAIMTALSGDPAAINKNATAITNLGKAISNIRRFKQILSESKQEPPGVEEEHGGRPDKEGNIPKGKKTGMFADLIQGVEDAKVKIEELKKLAAQPITLNISGFLDSLAAITTFGKTVIQLVGTMAKSVVGSVGVMAKSSSSLISAMAQGSSNVVNAMAKAIASVVTAMKNSAITSFGAMAKTGVSVTASMAKSMVSSVGQMAASIISSASKAASSFSSSMSKIASSANSAKSAVNSLKSAIGGLQSKTITITTRFRTVGSPPGGRARGGVEYSATSRTTLWGEGGPEIAAFFPLRNVGAPRKGDYDIVVPSPTLDTSGIQSALGKGLESRVPSRGGPTHVHITIPVYLTEGLPVIKKFVKDIVLEDVGMFPTT